MRIVIRLICVLVLSLPLLLGGCRVIGAIGYLFGPRQIVKPEFKLTEGRLAIVVDHARAGQANPVFDINLHKTIVERLRHNKVLSDVVPYDEVVRLRQANPDFRQWSIQKIGRALRADQVLCIRVDELRLRSSPSDPVIVPHVRLRLKLIGVQEPAVHARLWPDKDAEPDGRTLTHTRQPKETDDFEVVDAEIAKLARETAHYVARHFHRWDQEVTPPREP